MDWRPFHNDVVRHLRNHESPVVVDDGISSLCVTAAFACQTKIKFKFKGIALRRGNFTAEHVIARGKMIKHLRALDGLVEGKK